MNARPLRPSRPPHLRRRGRALVDELPRIGRPGSRSAELHEPAHGQPGSGDGASYHERNRFFLLRWLGAVGTLLIALGGFGGGALPVVDNPWFSFGLGSAMGRMMLASNAVVLIGVGMLVCAWLLMAPFVGASGNGPRVATPAVQRTLIAWVVPLMFTAPLFTQDIYSYLANGAIVRMGLDPYAAGPVEILGVDHPLARSVPFIWAHSPSPYGPVALGIAAVISWLTGDTIFLGVIAHRLVSLAGLLAASWGLRSLAHRCGVNTAAALWLGLLNPLTILHLVGGIHNEAIMLGFILAGLEVGLRGVDVLPNRNAWALIAASGALITCAGLVKVTGFFALGFTGMALARALHAAGRPTVRAIAQAVLVQSVLLVATTAVVSLSAGIGLGWVTGQGGAASIRSWLSLTTDIGVIGGFIAMLLGLGDHTEAMLVVTRTAGLAVAVAFGVRMLWATFKGTIHPVGGLGVATLVLVVLFPVVHPWYPLWAILPLAAWANRVFFRVGVAAYSAVFSFLVLPRGLALQPGAVATIYLSAALTFAMLIVAAWLVYRRRRGRVLH